jgi:amidase
MNRRCAGLSTLFMSLMVTLLSTVPGEGGRFHLLRIEEPTIADIAAELDAKFRQSGRTGPLHCIPVIVKDNYDTALASLEPRAPVKNLEEIIASKNFHPSIEKHLADAQAVEPSSQDNPKCQSVEEGRRWLREAVLKVMDGEQMEALVYPTWNNPARLIGQLNTPHGNNNSLFSPPTGFPAITVPMGFGRGELPAGLQFLGRPWSEPTLIKLAYACEQATKHRRPAASVPPFSGEPKEARSAHTTSGRPAS